MPMLQELVFAGGRLFVLPLFAEMSDIRVIDVSKRPWIQSPRDFKSLA